MRIKVLFWPAVLIVLLAIGWMLTGPAGDRPLWPIERTDLQVYQVVLAAGFIIAGAGRMILTGGRATRRHATVWSAAMIAAFLVWSSREDLNDLYDRARGNLHPSVALSTTQGEAELHRAWDGHYRAEAEINGIPTMMLVDTGATMVLLPYEIVHRLGINRAKLDFSLPVTTANGKSTVAPVTLSSIKIGPIAAFDVDAAVAQPGKLKTGLLGMSFLDKLDETSFSKGKLLLRN